MLKNIIRLMVILLFLHIASSNLVSAQEMTAIGDNEVYIGGIQLRKNENVLIVEYDLNLGKNVSSCKVNMSLSLDGGESFSCRPTDIDKYLSGDVGKVSGPERRLYISA